MVVVASYILSSEAGEQLWVFGQLLGFEVGEAVEYHESVAPLGPVEVLPSGSAGEVVVGEEWVSRATLAHVWAAAVEVDGELWNQFVHVLDWLDS